VLIPLATSLISFCGLTTATFVSLGPPGASLLTNLATVLLLVSQLGTPAGASHCPWIGGSTLLS
jgi:hypothetical protein